MKTFCIILPAYCRNAMFKRLPLTLLAGTLALYSCDAITGKSKGDQSDTSVAKDTVRSAAAVAMGDDAFPDYVKSIKQVTLPFTKEQLAEVEYKYLFADHGNEYTSIKAGRVDLPDGNTLVVYSGEVNSDLQEVWIITYSPEGKEISRLKEGGYSGERSGAVDPERTTQFFTIYKDNLVEIKEHYIRWGKEETKDSLTIRYYQLLADGTLAPQSKESEPFSAYQDRFPVIRLPFTTNKADNKGLTLISKRTPYYKYEDYIYYDWRVYAYGRLTIPGKAPVLMYVNDEAEEGESVIGALLTLVSYTPQGKIIDQLKIAGEDGGEGGTYLCNNALITPDGTISFTERNRVNGEYLEFSNTHTITYDMEYKLDAAGKFKPIGASSIVYDMEDFGIDNIKEYFKNKSATSAGDQEEVQFAIPGANKIVVGLFGYQKDGECLLQLFTAGKDSRIIDTYPLYNTLKQIRYEDIAFLKLDNEYEEREKRGELLGTVTIKMKDKTLQIDRQGRFVK
jgi:hypothetical protein